MGNQRALRNRIERLDLKRRFHDLSLRSRVVLCQLPLALTMLLVTATVWAVDPAVLDGPWFRLCLLLHVLVLALCALVPWERLPFRSFQLIPVADFALVGLAMEGAGESIQGLGLLMVFPVI
jgi:two-component system, OmpR family, phosphate regulon sensor histidine kinase PhoR